MDRTLGEHVRALEERMTLVSEKIMKENDSNKRNHLESELRAVESALDHYRAAFRERDIAKPTT